jgi:hydrogenase/urease accessory protein HupE
MSNKWKASLVGLALLVSDSALAHAPIEGIGNFYNGLLHPILIPAHLLLLVAIGLFIGQQGSEKVEATLASFALATIIGLTLSWFSIGIQAESLILILSTATGLLIAFNPQVKRPVAMIVGALTGFSLGIDSAQEMLSGQEKLASLFGSGIAIYFLALYPMALSSYFNKKTWQKIGVRIVGSWVAASSLLVLALAFSKRA